MLINYFNIEQVRVVPSLSVFKSDEQLRQTFFGGNKSSRRSDRQKTGDQNEIQDLKMIVFEEIDAGDKGKILQDRKIKAKEKGKSHNALANLIKSDPESKPSIRKDRDDSVIFNSSTLSLSAWLDVFDGLMALQNKIVVISTNDKAYLDPAVYRKRRVTMCIEFQCVSRETFTDFVSQRFPGLESKRTEDLCEAVSEGELNHAELYDAYYSCDNNLDLFYTLILRELEAAKHAEPQS